VRRRGRDSRRVTRSSRTSPRALSLSEDAARTRGAPLATRSDPSRTPRDAVEAIRDAVRKSREITGRHEGGKTESESFPSLFRAFPSSCERALLAFSGCKLTDGRARGQRKSASRAPSTSREASRACREALAPDCPAAAQ
jgi:hypothetical protein